MNSINLLANSSTGTRTTLYKRIVSSSPSLCIFSTLAHGRSFAYYSYLHIIILSSCSHSPPSSCCCSPVKHLFHSFSPSPRVSLSTCHVHLFYT